MTDDYAAYQNMFTEHQLCWAHLIRKAIKLTLQAPDNQEYRQFADALLDLYRWAKRSATDRRLNEARREKRVTPLNAGLVALCAARYAIDSTDGGDVENDFRRLASEIMRLQIAGELFLFVTTVGVDGNNNASERELRDSAKDRTTGRANKTAKGAKRQSILTIVLRTLLKQTAGITLWRLIENVNGWLSKGRSCFADQAEKLGLQLPRPPSESGTLLDRVALTVDDRIAVVNAS